MHWVPSLELDFRVYRDRTVTKRQPLRGKCDAIASRSSALHFRTEIRTNQGAERFFGDAVPKTGRSRSEIQHAILARPVTFPAVSMP